MNYNNNNNGLTNYSRYLDIPNHQHYYSFSSNQGHITHEQQHQQEKQKKKSRGNQKLQRYRQKLRRQGMNADAIARSIEEWVNTNSSKSNQMEQQKLPTKNSSINKSVFRQTTTIAAAAAAATKPTKIKQRSTRMKTKRIINHVENMEQVQTPTTNEHGYFDFASFIGLYDINPIDDPFINEIMINEAVMKLFHPDEYKAMIKLAKGTTTTAAAATAEDEEEQEEKQVHDMTCFNQHLSDEQNTRRSTGIVNLSIDKWKLSPELTPNYSKIPNQQFKNSLCQANPSYRQQLQQHLSNPKLLSFVQQYAHFMSMRFQLEMEKDYWKHAIDGLLSAVKWLSRMPKNLTRRYSINWDYPRTECNIRHRQRLTENKLNQICQQVRIHSQQYSSCWSISDKTLIDQIMHMICDALKVMIGNDLQNLHTRFEQKKILLQYDAYDIYLLKSFYDLHPSEDQKVTMEKLCRGKRKSCQRRIRQIKTNSLNNEQVDTSVIFNETNQQYQTSFLKPLNPAMRTIIENRQANIEKRTQQIIAFQNTSSSV